MDARPHRARKRIPDSTWWAVAAPIAPALASMLFLASCSGPQSALVFAGRDAERIGKLFWWMTGGAFLIWAAVIALAFYCVRLGPYRGRDRLVRTMILGGGAVVPTIVLAGLLAYGLRLMPEVLAAPPPGGLTIAVSGEQWWWRVRYHPQGDGDAAFELANEIRLPVGERTELRLTSPDVIHSFWVPSLGGKMDMIPGRVTRIALEPQRTGLFRGVCAEYCGASHALMAFDVVVVEKETFRSWMERESLPAQRPVTTLAARGAELFTLHGCGSCHQVRGTAADGVVGPDLTHVGSRTTLGAGTLPIESRAIAHWIEDVERIKPGSRMPSFDMLARTDVRAIAAYLEGLE